MGAHNAPAECRQQSQRKDHDTRIHRQTQSIHGEQVDHSAEVDCVWDDDAVDEA